MKYKVLFMKDMHPSGKKLLEENDCNILISKAKTEADLFEELRDVDALFVRNEKVTPAMMDQAGKLKVIAKHGVGYDNINIEYATKKKIQVVFVPFGNNNSVAEHTMMLILNCAKRCEYITEQFKADNYNVRFSVQGVHEVAGKVLGIIGCGHIGRLVAQKAKWGFGMNVIGYDPYASQEKLDEEGAPITLVKSKKELLNRADFVSLHLPATPDSIHSVGMEDFLEMKESAYLINTSRGNIVKEDELIQALKDKLICGAGLDVFETEPVSAEHPLLHMEQVFATPHCAGATMEASENLSHDGAMGIIEVLQGKKVTYPVNHLI